MLNDGEVKADLQRYLQVARDVLVWKLDGLSEYEIRRPLTPTATNLLGLVKHLAGVELGYFGLVFDRPFDGQVAWFRPDLPEDALDPAAMPTSCANSSTERLACARMLPICHLLTRHGGTTIETRSIARPR